MEQVSTRLRLVLEEDSAARRESSEAVRRLEQEIASRGQEQVIERVAYTWFNRFCALRFHGREPLHPHRCGIASGGAVSAGNPG